MQDGVRTELSATSRNMSWNFYGTSTRIFTADMFHRTDTTPHSTFLAGQLHPDRAYDNETSDGAWVFWAQSIRPAQQSSRHGSGCQTTPPCSYLASSTMALSRRSVGVTCVTAGQQRESEHQTSPANQLPQPHAPTTTMAIPQPTTVWTHSHWRESYHGVASPACSFLLPSPTLSSF